jgi:hypothetical protein
LMDKEEEPFGFWTSAQGGDALWSWILYFNRKHTDDMLWHEVKVWSGLHKAWDLRPWLGHTKRDLIQENLSRVGLGQNKSCVDKVCEFEWKKAKVKRR